MKDKNSMDSLRIAVIGAGTMGHGIGLAAAMAGCYVNLFDSNSEVLMSAKTRIDVEIEQGLARKKLGDLQADEIKQNIRFIQNLELAVRDADLVIEAIPEVMHLKKALFEKLDVLCPDHTVFATNTSTMSPSEIAAATNRADRVVAMHFFNPAHKMKLVEIIRGLDTSQKTIDFVRNVATLMKKVAVDVDESPGFIAGRISCLVGNEAMNMLMEGIASAADIDKAVQLGLGYPMGPLELADLVGLDSRLKNVEYLHSTLGEKYRPPLILRKYVIAGRLGRKTGRGFFVYDQQGNKISPRENE